MKRFFILLCAAIAAVACNNGKQDKPLTPVEKNLLGVWTCTEQITPKGSHIDNPALAFVATADRKLQYCDNNDCFYNWTWSIDGDKLILTDDEFIPISTVINNLDGTYLSWTMTDPAGAYTESYINVSDIITGDWVVKWALTSYYAVINPDGTSSWTRVEDSLDMGVYNWYLSITDDSHVQINFNKGTNYVPLTIVAASFNKISAHDKDGAPVTIERE